MNPVGDAVDGVPPRPGVEADVLGEQQGGGDGRRCRGSIIAGRRVAGIACFGLAALLLIGGLSSASQGPALNDRSGLGVSSMVGAFLPALIALIVGLWLFQKPRAK